jgi:hypothetical protein
MLKRALIPLVAVTLVCGGVAAVAYAATNAPPTRATCTANPNIVDRGSSQQITVVCSLPKPPAMTVTATAPVTETVTVSPSDSPTPSQAPTEAPSSTTPTPTQSASPTVTASQTPTPTPTPTATSTTPASGNVCTADKAFVNHAGERYDWTDWSAGSISGEAGSPIDYYADAGLWNSGPPYNVTQHSVFCDHDSWYAVVTDNDAQHDGAVKNYPNTHLDYHSWADGTAPSLTAYPDLHSRFAHQTEANAGSYNWSYDIWLNGVGWDGSSTEVMIWTDYKNRVPWPVSVVKNITVDGRQWNLWREDTAHGFQFLPADGQPITSGTFDLRAFFNALINRGFIKSTATLGQVDYGVETVSTNSLPKRFDVTDFSVWPLPPDYYH